MVNNKLNISDDTIRKWELYYESIEKKDKEFRSPLRGMTMEQKASYIFSKKRQQENRDLFNSIKFWVTAPYTLPRWFFRQGKKFIGIVTYSKVREAQEREIRRLKMVMESKERARAKMVNDIEYWDNSYLIEDGIFAIGRDRNTGEKIILDFNKFANLLIGGLPGGGKTKCMQLLIFQCLKHGCNVWIGDFKGGTDTIRFQNKCTVITDHNELLRVLKAFKREIKRRIDLFISVGAENLKEYNQMTKANLKREYLFIDELGEAMEVDMDGLDEKELKTLKKELEKNLKSIVRLGRAFGCNVIAGTQRPDVGVIEGQARSQFGCRVCFQSDRATSLIVLDDKIASELDDTPGRAIVKKRNTLVETQIYFWDKETLSEIKNKKLSKDDLKIVKNTQDEKENRETDEIIDVDVDL